MLLALSGIGIIGISIGISYGLGSAFQFKYTAVHNVLPFLLLGKNLLLVVNKQYISFRRRQDLVCLQFLKHPSLSITGIGVDDIFVIIQSWENVGGSKPDHRTIPEKVSQALRHSGVAVLATSVTDICAFAVGSATVSILKRKSLSLEILNFNEFSSFTVLLLIMCF